MTGKMTEIKPFRGIHYDTDVAGPIETLIAPPYDVVDKSQRDMLVGKNPNNIFSVELPDQSQCPDAENKYSCANEIFSMWLRNGIMVRDTQPAFYAYDIDYRSGSTDFCRRGFIGLVRLADWSEKKILPHEKTFDKVTKDRFSLTEATLAQFSPIFMLYRHSSAVTEILASAQGVAAQEVTDPLGNRHRVSALTSEDITRAITEALKDSTLYIADGHHRYTTALRFRDAMLQKEQDATAAFNYIMTYLVDAEDPGLIVLPTHRILKTDWSSNAEGLANRASDFFEIETVAKREEGYQKISSAIEENLNKRTGALAIGVIAGEHAQVWTLRDGCRASAFSQQTPEPLRQLDVVLLEDAVFKTVLKLDSETEENNIRFSADAIDAMESMKDDEIMFYMRPTPVHQVLDIADQGLTMPHKSTFFYPKILTGMVVNSLT